MPWCLTRGAGTRKGGRWVLLTAADQVPEGEPLIGVAVSTRPTDPLPAECVRLPSSRQKQGSSRLPERSAAVCNWPVKVYRERITEEDIGGVVYGEILEEIVKKVTPHLGRAQPPALPPSD
jgi:hypothetical protein